jgi:hypothetical protein
MSRKYSNQYRSTLNASNLISSATVVCTAGVYTQLGEYQVLPGDLIALGYSDLDDQSGAVGRIYVLLKDNTGTPVEVTGTYRLSLMSEADRQLSIEFECRTEITDNNPTDRTKQLPFEVSNTWLSSYKRFQLSINPDVTKTVVLANSTILVDITKEAV